MSTVTTPHAFVSLAQNSKCCHVCLLAPDAMIHSVAVREKGIALHAFRVGRDDNRCADCGLVLDARLSESIGDWSYIHPVPNAIESPAASPLEPHAFFASNSGPTPVCLRCGSGRSALVHTSAAVERVNHPPHYGGDSTYEVIKVIDAWELDFTLGNAVKYIARADKKIGGNALEDLKKARWYLEHEIRRRQSTLLAAAEAIAGAIKP